MSEEKIDLKNLPLTKVDFNSFNKIIEDNFWTGETREEKKRIYVKTNKGIFNDGNLNVGEDFALALLLFQIRENISDLMVNALNNVEWNIHYIKNKQYWILKYEEIRPYLIEIIDFFFQNLLERERKEKIEFYDVIFGNIKNWDMRLIYDTDQIKPNYSWDVNEWNQFVYENLSEKKLKILTIGRINEAFAKLFGFVTQVKPMDSNITIGYSPDLALEDTKEYSFRIAGMQQSIAIDWRAFYSFTSRLLFSSFLTLSQLGVWEYEQFFRANLLSKQLNLIAWETNSGKSTTIFSLKNEMYVTSNGSIRFLSYEDPIEKPVDFINQTQGKQNRFNEDDAYTIEDAERLFMRSAPDGILVWEIRDKETAEIAIKMALSGHYTYATIHSDSVLSVTKRFAWLGVNMERNITAFWFVEVTQLTTTYETKWYPWDDKSIEEKIDSWLLKIKDLEYIPYEWWEEYQEYKKWKKNKEDLKITDKIITLFNFISGRTFLINLLTFKKTQNLNAIFTIQGYYLSYIKYLSTYFSNRYVDGDDFLEKKQHLIPVLKSLHSLIQEKKYRDLIINPFMKQEDLQQLYVAMLKKAKEILTEEEVQDMAQNQQLIQEFFKDKYVSSSNISIPFTYNGFVKLLDETGYIPFNIPTKWVSPIIELFDYKKNYKCVVNKDEDFLLYKTEVFTPMFLYGLIVNQHNLKDKQRCMDFFNIISMFGITYEL